ncbi:hypothetical protein SLEP1_g4003 [Rubroshorea leprosula]|uniref:Uncharacterized protein n=1 Tax=Rubroshorea leprosula TaxID=152421 RepID=A0AAV5HY02_9ROSI|nr:hypothetical protein SLEP1_g4003 [Rubroshorea leprosula]
MNLWVTFHIPLGTMCRTFSNRFYINRKLGTEWNFSDEELQQ